MIIFTMDVSIAGVNGGGAVESLRYVRKDIIGAYNYNVNSQTNQIMKSKRQYFISKY